MLFPWDMNLEIGNDVIDDQHKEIFSRANKLLSAMADGKGREEVDKVVVFLTNYVVNHFSEEESLMSRHCYSDYSRHKNQHAQFINNVSRLKMEFETQGATSDLVIQTKKHVCNWLRDHISKTDKAFGTFLKNKS